MASDTAFTDSYVEADGFRIRYRESGQGQDKGEPLVCLHGAGGLRLSRAHELLADDHRVVAFEIPGFGASPANERSASLRDLAHSMGQAVAALGIERFNLMGHSFGAKLALWMAIARPDTVETLVMVAPAIIRLDRPIPPVRSREDAMALLHAHPERQPARAPLDPEIEAKQQALVRRLIGPPRDAELEDRMPDLNVPVLALFGTEDRVTPPEAAPLYAERLPNCHLMMIYDAAHAIDADRPEAVASVVTDFVQRRESFLVNDESALIHP